MVILLLDPFLILVLVFYYHSVEIVKKFVRNVYATVYVYTCMRLKSSVTLSSIWSVGRGADT